MWALDYVTDIPAQLQRSMFRLILRSLIGGFVDTNVSDLDAFTLLGSEASVTLSNVTVSKERLAKLSRNRFGIEAKEGLIRTLKVAIQWKDLLRGKLSLTIDGLQLGLDAREEALEPTVWFDALSESLYDTLQGAGRLEERLEAEVAEMLASDSEALSEASSEYSSEAYKAMLKRMVRDLQVRVTGISASLRVLEDAELRVRVETAELTDDTENQRAAELDVPSSESNLYMARTLQASGLAVTLVSGPEEAPLLTLDRLEASLKLLHDRTCEFEGVLGEACVSVAARHIAVLRPLLGLLSPALVEPPAASASGPYALTFGKLRLGRLELRLAESDFGAAWWALVMADCLATRFATPDGGMTTQASVYSFSLLQHRAEGDAVLTESLSEEALTVTMDRLGIKAVLNENIEVRVDRDMLRLARSFERALAPASGCAAGEPSAARKLPPLSVSIANIRLQLADDLLGTAGSASVAGLAYSLADRASSVSLHEATVYFGGSSATLSGATLIKKRREPEPPVAELDPFSPLHHLLEDEQFIGVASADRALELQETLQMAAAKNTAVSCRGVKLQVRAEDLVVLTRLLARLPSTQADPAKVPACLRVQLASLEADFAVGASTHQLALADMTLFRATHFGPADAVLDVRGDLVTLSRGGQRLVKKILTLSLDNSFKNLVLTTMQRPGARAVVSAQVAGLQFKVPLQAEFTEELALLGLLGAPSGEPSRAPWDVFVRFFKCSLTPIVPAAWPRCFPSAVFPENLRLVTRSAEAVRLFVDAGTLFLARRHKKPLALGIYEEGLTYWRDHGYAPVGRIQFLKVTGTRLADGVHEVRVENEDVRVEVREDSVHVAKHFFEYLGNMSRYGPAARAAAVPPAPAAQPAVKTELQQIDEFMFSKSLSPAAERPAPSTIEFEEDFFTLKERPLDEDFALLNPADEWEAAPGVPAPEPEPAAGQRLVFGAEPSPLDAVHGSQQEGLAIDDDYFAAPLETRDSFPFSSRPHAGRLRVKLVDVTVRVLLVEGFHYRRSEPVRKAARAPSFSGCATGSPSDSLSIRPPSFHQEDFSKRSSPSATSFSRWSVAAPAAAGGSMAKPDVVEVLLERINCEADLDSRHGQTALAAVRLVVRRLEVVDLVKSSRWKTVLGRRVEQDEQTPLEDGSSFDSMVRCELAAVDNAAETEEQLEYRLKVRLLPLRIHLDQDTLKFLLRFLVRPARAAKKGRGGADSEDDLPLDDPDTPIEPLFFQHCDIGEISLKIDYKPKRIDFQNIRLGNLVECVNFFQLEDAEVHLPAASLRGVRGTGHFVAELTRAWLPYIKDTQLSKMVKGIAPVRTVINLGTGLSDLILLPMHEYRREGRVLRGLRRGAGSFVHSTVLEGARLGSRLAMGTQVILEKVDDVFEGSDDDALYGAASVSKAADQPENVQEGLVAAYHSLASNLTQAMQTIVAVPVQVYERSGPEGAAKAVIRAVPVAVLRPIIGATEAVSKTLLGVENSLDPARGIEIKRKYKPPGL